MNRAKRAFGMLFFLFLAVSSQAEDVSIALDMPGCTFSPGMMFWLDLKIQNDGPDIEDAQLYVAFTMGSGTYWFYPGWRQYPGDVDWEEISILGTKTMVRSIIPEFVWPENVGEFEGAMFLSVITSSGKIVSNIAEYTFGWVDEPAYTFTPVPTHTPVPPTATSTPSPEPTNTPTPVPTDTPFPRIFLYVYPGKFFMGSPPSERCREDSEDPLHKVKISHGFYMQSTEVTRQQWEDVFGNIPNQRIWYKDFPVNNITWFDCCIFCNRLSIAEGYEPCYYSDESFKTVFDGDPPVYEGTVYWKRDANGYRLPTEAEWEYTCRAGTTTAYNNGKDNRNCKWDDNLYRIAWYFDNSNQEFHMVGRKLPNNWGFYDMLGNVWEWCWDWYDSNYYETSPPVDPTGPPDGTFHVIRGGCFYNSARYCRSASRGYSSPAYNSVFKGFRILREDFDAPTPTFIPITPTSIPSPGVPTCTATPVPMRFVYIEAGTFDMGSPPEELCRYVDEGPIHSVTLTRDFIIQTTEVTQHQWVEIFGENPSYHQGCLNCPVEKVSWVDSCIFCNRLSIAEGYEPCYYSDESFTTILDGTPPVSHGKVYWKQDANGYRLPTEAEWEYACRGGKLTAYNSGRNNIYCLEDPELNLLGWYYFDSAHRQTHPVGLKQPNEYGLYDMHGNVKEWCWDKYGAGYYRSSPPTDPTGSSSGPDFSVVRGGSWKRPAMRCRSASRDYAIRYFARNSEIGFRVVRFADNWAMGSKQ